MFNRKKILSTILILSLTALTACSSNTSADTTTDTASESISVPECEPFTPTDEMIASTLTEAAENLQSTADMLYVAPNINETLSVPTYISKIEDTWFIVDCYHNQIIYNTELSDSLYDWKVMTSDCIQPHTIASDGTVYLIDDTENNRVLIYEKVQASNGEQVFIQTQLFNDIGSRPHYCIYDENTKTFYVWSSTTGELYLFRHGDNDTRMYLTEIRSIEELNGIYVRSFTITDGLITFVSGVNQNGSAPEILVCKLSDLSILERYLVPDELAGMVQITPIEDKYYITVSTDITGNQDYATIIRTDSLEELQKGNYEDIYSTYFVGGGTPYYITHADGSYFLTEHRLTDHQIWRFDINSNTPTNITTLY
ncbi:MAG: hypothetical protein K6B41_00830 [Butyrivibrio sp.]|nr:hypothetical protein [Butyrivibrio sp.]